MEHFLFMLRISLFQKDSKFIIYISKGLKDFLCILYMEFKCRCCNSDFTTNSNLRKHERSAKHKKLMERLELEPTENVQFRNTISEIEIENGVLKKRILDLEQELKKKQEAIDQIVKVVNNLAESKI